MYNDTITILINAMMYAMDGEDPSKAIEDYQKNESNKIIRDILLPKTTNNMSIPKEIKFKGIDDSIDYRDNYELLQEIAEKNNIEYTKQQYEKMGIQIIGDHNDVLYKVVLPGGWRIETEDYWSNLYDNEGRQRASFFYKNTIYDLDAFINFND